MSDEAIRADSAPEDEAADRALRDGLHALPTPMSDALNSRHWSLALSGRDLEPWHRQLRRRACWMALPALLGFSLVWLQQNALQREIRQAEAQVRQSLPTPYSAQLPVASGAFPNFAWNMLETVEPRGPVAPGTPLLAKESASNALAKTAAPEMEGAR